jgi:hypothetical protein
VVQRRITYPDRANDDYMMALVEDIIPALQAAGLMTGDVITRDVLMNPEFPNILSSTRARFQQAPILTQNIVRSTSNDVQQALSLVRELVSKNDLGPLTKGSNSFRSIVKRAISDFSTRHGGTPSMPERLAGLVLGKKSVDVTG